jgi:hypothetical protein
MPSTALKLALPIAAATLFLLAACGGGESNVCDDASQVVGTQPEGYAPIVISSDLAVGENRFALGLTDEMGAPVAGADLTAQFCQFTGADEAVLISESALSAITVERSFTHIHEDGALHQHDIGEVGIYVTNVDFPAAGNWQVFVSGTVGDAALEPAPYLFQVQDAPRSPAIGAAAPQSVQLTVDDVEDITEIDTSTPPNPEMHDMTIADAVTSGKPTVIVFATPAFCTSQICGPTKEVVDVLYPEYKDKINFVHVEPYDVERARSGDCMQGFSDCVLPFITDEWGLTTEPWVFTVDAQGNIAGKFEGVVGQTELEEHLQELLAG